MVSFAWGLARREPGQRSPWRLARRLAGFVFRPVGGVATQAARCRVESRSGDN
jgi:hypothetical protein